MKEKWEVIVFEIVKFKNTKSFIIVNFEKVENQLDVHLSETQALLVNPYKKPYLEEIELWLSQLVVISNVIEEWRRF